MSRRERECPDCGMPESACWREQAKAISTTGVGFTTSESEATTKPPELADAVLRETRKEMGPYINYGKLCAYCDARESDDWRYDRDGRLVCGKCARGLPRKVFDRRRR